MFNLVTFLKVGYSMTVRVLAPVLKVSSNKEGKRGKNKFVYTSSNQKPYLATIWCTYTILKGNQSEASGTSLLSRESMRDRDWLCCTTQHPRTSGTKPTQASFRIEELTMVTEWLDRF